MKGKGWPKNWSQKNDDLFFFFEWSNPARKYIGWVGREVQKKLVTKKRLQNLFFENRPIQQENWWEEGIQKKLSQKIFLETELQQRVN